MSEKSYITALHVVDQHEGTHRVLELLVPLIRKHNGHRGKMAAELGVSEVTLWRYIKFYKEAHGEYAVQNVLRGEAHSEG